ncbi:hypothetical protein ANN_10096 [Periplaneta americana]|uniref:Uncharacterized protein n=1 Tax=Periplaneta americana TaxID=6978 RepID=A0ABQ8TR63_PERAM|nr:hypothetical protein ANN_10096 [Periplaneta americana]
MPGLCEGGNEPAGSLKATLCNGASIGHDRTYRPDKTDQARQTDPRTDGQTEDRQAGGEREGERTGRHIQ